MALSPGKQGTRGGSPSGTGERDGTPRLDVVKTYKLYIDGKFPRSESGRTIELRRPVDKGAERGAGEGALIAHVCRSSRKDVRDAVTAARKGFEAWRNATAYNRGQVLYRMAEMVEGKRGEFVEALEIGRAPTARTAKRRGATSAVLTPAREVKLTIDRLVAFAGWADKVGQVLGCNNPVAGPYYNFTVPEGVGVVAVIGPDEPGLLGVVSLMAPALCAGNACVALAGESAGAALAAVILGEVMATSDVPAGVVNVLTGLRSELAPVFASHRDVDAIVAAGVDAETARVLREGSAENLKRVRVEKAGSDFADVQRWHSSACFDGLVEMKTMWHPSAT